MCDAAARGRISSAAVKAHIPSMNPTSAHMRADRPRRAATVAVSGARAASITSEVAIISAGLPRYRIKAKPEVTFRMLAIVHMVCRVARRGYSEGVMARRDAENIISKLRQVSEEGLSSVMGELMANERMRKGLGKAGERLMANKHAFDRNVETVLDFVNIPSKRDIRELKSRLDTLSSQLVNLSMKIDRMMAANEEMAPVHEASPTRQAPRRRKGR